LSSKKKAELKIGGKLGVISLGNNAEEIIKYVKRGDMPRVGGPVLMGVK
jgi:hypothetical protein